MKRSKSLTLILMGSLALGSAGCGSEEKESYKAFTTIQECVQSELFSEAECKEFAESALAQSPKFGSKEECERKFGVGGCQGGDGTPAGTVVQQGSQSSWMPMMMGFMAGRYLSGGGMMQGSQPLYRNDQQQGAGGSGSSAGARSFRTASGETVRSDAKGTVSSPSSAVKQSLGFNAKPAASRVGGSSSGGFSGSKGFFGGGS